jgi:hypothetical protein
MQAFDGAPPANHNQMYQIAMAFVVSLNVRTMIPKNNRVRCLLQLMNDFSVPVDLGVQLSNCVRYSISYACRVLKFGLSLSYIFT